MPNFNTLKTEIALLAYNGLTDTQIAAALNAPLNVQSERTTVPASDVFEQIVPAEWAALSAAEKQRVQTILGMGTVNLQGANTRASLAAAFAAGTTTRANLLALQNQTSSTTRAIQIGWPEVGAGDVTYARAH